MLISITRLRLKSPLQIPRLIRLSSTILKQLETTGCKGVKTHGLWKNHYTMTEWESYEAMRDFATSGAHKEAMKMSKSLSEEILVLSLEQDTLPSWSEVKELLMQEGSVYRF
jgi:hypothetical protein